MFRLPDQEETLHALDLMSLAVTERRIVRVSFLERYSVGPHKGRTRPPAYAEKRNGAYWFKDSFAETFGVRELLESRPTHWTVEPVLVDLRANPQPVPWSNEPQPAPYADVIRHGPNGPRARTVRLDRIVVHSGSLALRVTREAARFRDTAYDPTITRR